MYGGYDTRDGGRVPFAIDEAERLYVKHMYVSLSLWQMWRTREECMTKESGLEVMPGSEGILDLPTAPSLVRCLCFVVCFKTKKNHLSMMTGRKALKSCLILH